MRQTETIRRKMLIAFDEMKPHWATGAGLDKVAETIGFRNVRVTGDFDAKVTHIIGEVENEAETRKEFEKLGWDTASLHRVADSAPKRLDKLIVVIEDRYIDLLVEEGHPKFENGVTLSVHSSNLSEVKDCAPGVDVTDAMISILGFGWYRRICEEYSGELTFGMRRFPR